MASQTIDTPAWVLAILGCVTAMVTFVRWFVALVRKLLVDIIETEVKRLIDEKHAENLLRFEKGRTDREAMNERLQRIEDRLA